MAAERGRLRYDNWVLTNPKSGQHAEELMKAHEDDLPEFSEKNWPPNRAGCAMIIGY